MRRNWSFGWPMARAYLRVVDGENAPAGGGWHYHPLTYLQLLDCFREGQGIPSIFD